MNTEPALYPLTSKRKNAIGYAVSILLVKPFAFGKYSKRKKYRKRHFSYVYEQMNSRRNEYLNGYSFYTWLSLENKVKAAVVITLFVPPFTSLEHIVWHPHTNPFPPEGTLFAVCQRDAIKDQPTQGPAPHDGCCLVPWCRTIYTNMIVQLCSETMKTWARTKRTKTD